MGRWTNTAWRTGQPNRYIGVEPMGHRYATQVYTCQVCGFSTERILPSGAFFAHTGRPDLPRHRDDDELCAGSYSKPG